MNNITIFGNVTKDPEIKEVTIKEEKRKVCTFQVASNRIGEEKADFFPVEVWGKQAENCAQYLKTGSGVYVAGTLSTDVYEKDNVKKLSIKIVDCSVQFTDKKKAE